MKLRNKLYIFTTLIVVASVILAAAFTVNLLYRGYERGISDELAATLRLIDSADISYGDIDFGSRRFTEIAPDGTVLFDSMADEERMENHLERPEVQDALEHSVGLDVRRSSTLLNNMFYVAILSREGNILRLSENQSSIYSFVLSSIPFIIIIICIILLIVLLIAHKLSKKIVEPINKIDLDNPITDDEIYEELSPLVRRIDDQKKEIKEQLKQIERDKSELELIVKSMKDGLILSRKNGEILMINDAAKILMGKNASESFHTLIELSREDLFFSIMEKGSASGRIRINGRTVEVHAEEVDGLGSAILLFDVSERLALEMKEREFIQNVSHELKTPLTSISGYSELIMLDKVDKDHIKEFSGQIYSEAKRLYSLIEDIMEISRMDEDTEVVLKPVSVNEIAKDVLESISNPIVSLRENANLTVNGNSTLIFEALYNLVDNAIKYNRNSNPIVVEIDSDGFAVIDQGIGLSPYDRERVFDRFYRVDKSRSRATGGTGLGLSIVKSVAERHNAHIEISSTLGEGTTISMHFKAN